jgi:hypothetical protein
MVLTYDEFVSRMNALDRAGQIPPVVRARIIAINRQLSAAIMRAEDVWQEQMSEVVPYVDETHVRFRMPPMESPPRSALTDITNRMNEHRRRVRRNSRLMMDQENVPPSN